MAETSTKPYLVRALYEWCCDNGYTPYLAVSVDADTRVPMQYVKGGEIVLNISPAATNRLTMDNDRIEFQARFSGVAQQLSIPVGNVTAIYARETGHGMAFDVTRIGGTDDGAALSQGDGAVEAHEAGAATDGGPAASAEVIAFGPDAAKRRRRGGQRGRRDGTDAGRDEGPGAAQDADEPRGRPSRPRPLEAPRGESGPRAVPDLAAVTETRPGSADHPPAERTVPSTSTAPTSAPRPSAAPGERDGDAEHADTTGPGAEAGSASADGSPEPRPPDADGAGKGRRSPRLTRVK